MVATIEGDGPKAVAANILPRLLAVSRYGDILGAKFFQGGVGQGQQAGLGFANLFIDPVAVDVDTVIAFWGYFPAQLLVLFRGRAEGRLS